MRSSMRVFLALKMQCTPYDPERAALVAVGNLFAFVHTRIHVHTQLV